MASIYREFTVEAPADHVWSAICDFGSVHQRLAVGFVTDVKLEGDIRIVTFFNGFTIKEQLVAVDHTNKRLVYTATGGRSTHHNSSFQVFPAGSHQTRVLWITDLLPEEAAVPVSQMTDKGIEAIKQTLKQ